MSLSNLIPLDLANRLYSFGWRASAIGAAITMVGVLLLYVGTRVRDHHFEEDIAELNSQAGKAHERTALLEKDAAEARLEQERLKTQFAWREVTPAQAELMRRAIGDKRMQITISWAAGDAEGSAFASSVALALQSSGCEISAFAPMGFLGQEPHGLSISGSERAEVELLASALTGANLVPHKVTVDAKKPGGTKYFTHLVIGYRSPPVVTRQPR